MTTEDSSDPRTSGVVSGEQAQSGYFALQESAAQEDPDRPVYRIHTSKLQTLNVRPNFFSYLAQLWQRRFFIQAEARAKAFQTARDLRLGKVWLILSPLIDSAMFGIIFGLLLHVNRGIPNFIGFVVIGITFFQVFTKQLTGGIELVKKNQNLTRSYNFPRASIVFSASLRLFYDTIPPMLVAIVFALAAQGFRGVSVTLLLAVPLFLLAHIFGTGLMFITARVTAFVPDLRIIFEVGSRAWFYGSGVFFAIATMPLHPDVVKVVQLNPAFHFLEIMRGAVMHGQVGPTNIWLVLIAWSFGTFFVGLIIFYQAEERYVRVR